MLDIKVRRYKTGDETAICEIIKKDVLTENIKDYPLEIINHLIETHNEELIIRRSQKFHTYVLTDNEKIVGVGMIGPYWDSLTESSFFTIFIDPAYKGRGLGRRIIDTLKQDEYYKRADRVEIPASISAVEFYKHMGWKFKRTEDIIGNIVDEEGIYRMEKYPKIDEEKVLQYNMRPYIDNEYHNYKEFIYQLKNNCVDGKCSLDDKTKDFDSFIDMVKYDMWIIQLDGVDIGFYNGITLDDDNYKIDNIRIIPEYQGKGIGTQVLSDVIKLHKNQDIYVECLKDCPVFKLYQKLGFIISDENDLNYVMVKYKEDKIKGKIK